MSDVDVDLAELRSKVASLDRQILELVAQRLDTTRRIGQAKARAGLPIRDFRVEVTVLSRARACAREFGFDAEVAEDIAEKLMAAAVQTQAELPASQPSGGQRQVLVIGGGGRMGAWLARFFDSLGHRVQICDPDLKDSQFEVVSLEEGVPKAEVIAVATPLGLTAGILEQVFERGGSPLVFDICSLKSPVSEVLRKAAQAGHRVTSLHPMFAPGAVLLHGRAVLVCDAGCAEATEEAKSLFAETALGLYDVTLEDHDKVMAVVLGMSHALNLQFATAVERYGLPFEFLGKIASTTFAKQIKTTAEVAEENPYLYHEIQHFNQHTPEMYEMLSDALQGLRKASLESNSGEFVELMERARPFFA